MIAQVHIIIAPIVIVHTMVVQQAQIHIVVHIMGQQVQAPTTTPMEAHLQIQAPTTTFMPTQTQVAAKTTTQ